MSYYICCAREKEGANFGGVVFPVKCLKSSGKFFKKSRGKLELPRSELRGIRRYFIDKIDPKTLGARESANPA